MPPRPQIRFRLWHLFMLVAFFSIGVWSFTQHGIVTAEIEILEVATWEPIEDAKSEDPNPTLQANDVVFQYVQPKDLSNVRIRLFMAEPTEIDSKITAGARFKFRYRARQFLWLKPEKPDRVAIQLIGLKPDQIEQIIHEVELGRDE